MGFFDFVINHGNKYYNDYAFDGKELGGKELDVSAESEDRYKNIIINC